MRPISGHELSPLARVADSIAHSGRSTSEQSPLARGRYVRLAARGAFSRAIPAHAGKRRGVDKNGILGRAIYTWRRAAVMREYLLRFIIELSRSHGRTGHARNLGFRVREIPLARNQ
jgi:hypothetical protein